MEKHQVGIRSLVAMALCALLALLAFLGFLVLMASSRGAWGLLGLAAVLACPAIWLAVLYANRKDKTLAKPAERAPARLRPLANSETDWQAQAGRRENGR